MYYGLLLTIGALFFAILLLLVYYSKNRNNMIRNKIFRYLLIASLFLTSSEIITVILLDFHNNVFLNLLMYRFQWFTGIVWAILLYYYSVVFISNIKEGYLSDIIKYNKNTKVATTIFAIELFGYFFVPFTGIDLNNVSYIPGLASYYTLILFASAILFIIVYVFKYGKNSSTRNKITIFAMLIEVAVVYTLQIASPYIAMYGIGIIIQMYFLYFMIENPDLQTISDMEKLKQEIEKSNKAKSDFLSNMSHEIRSPMNAIVGFSQTLLNDKEFDEDNARNDIGHIASAGNSLLEIIDNILDISKIESGDDSLELKEYKLSSIVMELSSIIDARLGNRPIKLIVEFDSKIPSKLYGDSTKIFQVLLNILTNAVKYTEVGKIKVSISCENNDDVSHLKFRIADTGFGIKKEDYDKMFSKFSRLQSATSKEIEGTGLGLVITKRYVELMGGKIWFESEYEVGTTFYIELNQKIIDKTPTGSLYSSNNSNIEEEKIDCSAYTALIVDDNKLNIKVASRLLGAYKFNIDTATSGKECIYKIKEGSKYDIIFLDHMMPEMDGIETLHILKKLEDYDLPPIVALTANAITGMKEMYLKEGFDEYLPKPISLTELDKLIKKYFSK